MRSLARTGARSPGWRPACGTCPTRPRSARSVRMRPGRGRCGCSSTSWFPACCRLPTTRGRSCPPRPHTSADEIEELVTARLARQALLARADPPLLYVLLDEGVLHRPVGTPQVMAGQLARLADLSEQTYVTLQVIPYSAGAHIGLQGGFAIADLPDLPGIVFLDSVADGQTI